MAICLAGCGIAAQRSDYFGEADAALSALRTWLDEQGLVIVPRKATSPMVEQGYYHSFSLWMPNESIQDSYDIARAQWEAMIAATPDALGKDTP